jgi:hypothetical protein
MLMRKKAEVLHRRFVVRGGSRPQAVSCAQIDARDPLRERVGSGKINLSRRKAPGYSTDASL